MMKAETPSKKFSIFNTAEGLNKFLGILKFPFFRIDYGAIETGRLYDYRRTRVLITAEHAETARIHVMTTKSGKVTFIPVGDKNTDKLAKLAAQFVGGAYILSRLPRTTVDMSRSPKDFRKKITLSVRVSGTKNTMTKLVIHANPKKERILNRYQKRVATLNPRIIISYHGMNKRHNSDITLGFGPNKIYIGGRKYARMFTKYFRDELNRTLDKMQLKGGMKVRRSKYTFLGRSNFVLRKNVMYYNRSHKSKRIGIHVEFNLRGRTRKSSKEVPKLRYQVAAQVLAKCAFEFWNRYRDEISESIERMHREYTPKSENRRMRREAEEKELANNSSGLI